MIDLGYSHYLFNIFLWCIVFLYYKPAINIPYQNKGGYAILVLFLLLYSTFGFNSGDFVHYYNLYNEISSIGINVHLEEFYYKIIIFSNSYYEWRFVVWGLSIVFLILTFRRLHYPPNLASLVVVLVLMFAFNNLRNALGYLCMFYFMSYITKPCKIKYFSWCIALVGVFISTFLHKSMPLYIVIALFSLYPLKKWMYILALCFFPLLYESFYYIASLILNSGYGGEQFYLTGMSHLDREQFTVTNINGYIQLFVNRIPMILLLFFSIKRYLNQQVYNKTAIFFLNYSFWLMYLSCLCFNQPSSSFLSPRFWDASLFSMALALPLFLFECKNKIIRLSFYLLIFSNMYNMMYSLYKL